MDDDGFKVDYSKLDLALARALSQSKKEPLTYMREQAGLLVKNIIQITPPGSAFSATAADKATGEAAQPGGVRPGLSFGKRKVNKQIRRVYGTPAQAWKLMRDKETFKGQAKSFWTLFNQGDTDRARHLFRTVTGESFSEWDGGALHKEKFVNGRVSGTRGKSLPICFTNDADALKNYIEERQQKIGWLAAGWNKAAAILNQKLASWIWRHSAPGNASVTVTNDNIRVKMTNNVSYAGTISDYPARVQSAVNFRASKITNTARNYMRKILNNPSFTYSD